MVRSQVTALSKQDGNMSQPIAIILGWLGDSSAFDTIITALSSDNKEIRYTAAEALGKIGDPRAVPYLIAALNDEYSAVRDNAMDALGEIGDTTAVQPLISILRGAVRYNENTDCRHAAEALGKIGDPIAIPSLLAAIPIQESFTNAAICKALGRLGAMKAVPLIKASAVMGNWYTSEWVIPLIHLAPADALEILDRYSQILEQESWVERLRGHTLIRMGRMDLALASFRQALDKEKTYLNLLALAHWHLMQNQVQLARDCVKQATEPESKRIRIMEGLHHWKALCLINQSLVLWSSSERHYALDILQQAQQIDWRVTKINTLQYEYFWDKKMIRALQEMLTQNKHSIANEII
jgi:HEAT repeat protein